MDPIHGLIHFNVFEREIIDSAQFQRLHFVLQNSTTYVSYPANKNSRFIHSLGCAHLAGDMLVHGLSKASKTDLTEFLSQCASFIYEHFIVNNADWKIDDAITGWRETIRGQSAYQHKPLLKGDDDILSCDEMIIAADHEDARQKKEMPALFVIDTIWQAIRVSGLVHDIGHLPMSHSFEKAIEQLEDIAVKSSDEDHAAIAKEAIQNISKRSKIAHDNDALLIRKIASEVFDISEEGMSEFLDGIEIHELRTLDILYYLSENSRVEIYTQNARMYRKLIYTISLIVLISSISEKGEYLQSDIGTKSGIALSALKGLVSGDVEADRMDYVT